MPALLSPAADPAAGEVEFDNPHQMPPPTTMLITIVTGFAADKI
jgi:hypothetical protein